MSATDQALDRIVQRAEDFQSVVEAIYRRRHTGTVLIHFFNGIPHKVEFPGVQIDLQGEGLDKPPKVVEPT